MYLEWKVISIIEISIHQEAKYVCSQMISRVDKYTMNYSKQRNNKHRRKSNTKKMDDRRHKRKLEKRPRELILRENDQQYAINMKALGNNRLEVFCMDTQIRQAYIRGNIANQKNRAMRIEINDLILISTREFGDNYNCDVIHKYREKEIKQLIKLGELPYDNHKVFISNLKSIQEGNIIENMDISLSIIVAILQYIQ